MDYRSWMYWVLSEELRKMDYCNGVDNFIDYALYNLKNISGGNIFFYQI